MSKLVCTKLLIIFGGGQIDPNSSLDSPLCHLLGFFKTECSPLLLKNLYSGKDMGTILVLVCGFEDGGGDFLGKKKLFPWSEEELLLLLLLSRFSRV